MRSAAMAHLLTWAGRPRVAVGADSALARHLSVDLLPAGAPRSLVDTAESGHTCDYDGDSLARRGQGPSLGARRASGQPARTLHSDRSPVSYTHLTLPTIYS